MGIQRSTYVLYGVRIADDQDWLALEEDPGQCCNNEIVGYFKAGRYDDDFYFLAVKWKEIEVGDYKLIDRDSMFEERKDQAAWNDALRAAAKRLNLTILNGPGWFIVPDEG